MAHAQNAWLGGTSGNWTDGPNWSLGIAPGAGGGGENDQAAIDNAPAARLDLSQLGGALFLNTLGIGGTAGSAGDLSIAVPSNGGFYSPIFPGAFALGTNGGTGTLTVDLTAGGTPSAAIVFGAGYAFGVGAGSAAQLNVLGIGLQGGTGNAQWLAIWADPANTTVFGDAGGTAQIAVSGAAAAIQAGAAGIALGSGAGSFGSMTIDNGGRGIFFADGSVSPQFIIGDSGGRGEVTVTGTGPDGTPSRVYFLQGQAVIGNGPGGVGVLTVTGGAQAISGPGPCTGGGGGNNGGGNNGGGNNGGSSGGNSKMADGSQPDPGKPELNKVVGTNDCASSGAPAIGLNGGSGTATVSGPGSIWYVTGRTPSSSDPNAPQIGAVGNLTVGGAGSTGVLTLADGGRVALGQGAFVADPNAGFLVSLTNFTTGLGTLSVAEPGASGTVNFGAPAGAAPVAPGFLEAAAIQFNDPNGRLVFNHTATDYTFAIPTSGPGSLQTLAGTTILTTPGAMAYTGPTLVDGGILRAGAVDVLSQGSQHSVGPAGQLDLAGFNQTVPGMTNAGLITMNPAPGAVPGTTLTVAGGNYVGQGGVIAINTVLAGDGAPSDRLVVNGGTATGDTILRVTNAGGTGALTAADGIQVVQAQNGGSTAAGAFRLDTRVAVGAFEYQLFRGGSTNANDWFLRSALIAVPGSTAAAVEVAPGVVAALPAPGAPAIPLYRPEVALYAPVPAIARQMGLATLGTLHERVGEEENLRGIAESRAYADGAWARAFGERVRNRWD
ncbi:MAG TPA: autotransporter outer membrane beta-barrel domain-containing protein, partial [Roseomonas sp.]